MTNCKKLLGTMKLWTMTELRIEFKKNCGLFSSICSQLVQKMKFCFNFNTGCAIYKILVVYVRIKCPKPEHINLVYSRIIAIKQITRLAAG